MIEIETEFFDRIGHGLWNKLLSFLSPGQGGIGGVMIIFNIALYRS